MPRRWKKKSSLNEGDLFKTKYGREFTIGGYDPLSNTYECIFEGLTKWVGKRSIHSGSIKHPNDKTVFSTGFIGIGRYDPKLHKDAYRKWTGMLKRVYAKDTHYQKNYEKVTIAEEWYSFQIFAEWFYEQYREDRWELDKDLYYLGKSDVPKCYSDKTCFLIPRELNLMLRGFKYNPKVQKERSVYRAYSEIQGVKLELGRFLSESNAKMVIVVTKVSVIEQWVKNINLPFKIDSGKIIREVCEGLKGEV